MKRLILMIVSILFVTGSVSAAINRPSEKGKLGLGIVIGSPDGVTGKFWVSGNTSLNCAVTSYSKDELYMQFDLCLHYFNILPPIEEGRLPMYFGAGVGFTSLDYAALRLIAGAEYIFKDYPFGIFLELCPALVFQPEDNFYIKSAFGARYYWGGSGDKIK